MASDFYDWQQDPGLFDDPAPVDDRRPSGQGSLRFLGTGQRSGSAGVAGEVARLRGMFAAVPRQVTR